MRSEKALSDLYARHVRTVWNICYPYFMNQPDTEDAVQDTFVKLMRSDKRFRDEQHEKAWLIVTARNVCRDALRRAKNRDLPLEAAAQIPADDPGPDETMQALSALPEKYRTVLYLYYYEGYGTSKLGKLLHLPDSTVRSHLRRGRALLKRKLGGI